MNTLFLCSKHSLDLTPASCFGGGRGSLIPVTLGVHPFILIYYRKDEVSFDPSQSHPQPAVVSSLGLSLVLSGLASCFCLCSQLL